MRLLQLRIQVLVWLLLVLMLMVHVVRRVPRMAGTLLLMLMLMLLMLMLLLGVQARRHRRRWLRPRHVLPQESVEILQSPQQDVSFMAAPETSDFSCIQRRPTMLQRDKQQAGDPTPEPGRNHAVTA